MGRRRPVAGAHHAVQGCAVDVRGGDARRSADSDLLFVILSVEGGKETAGGSSERTQNRRSPHSPREGPAVRGIARSAPIRISFAGALRCGPA